MSKENDKVIPGKFGKQSSSGKQGGSGKKNAGEEDGFANLLEFRASAGSKDARMIPSLWRSAPKAVKESIELLLKDDRIWSAFVELTGEEADWLDCDLFLFSEPGMTLLEEEGEDDQPVGKICLFIGEDDMMDPDDYSTGVPATVSMIITRGNVRTEEAREAFFAQVIPLLASMMYGAAEGVANKELMGALEQIGDEDIEDLRDMAEACFEVEIEDLMGGFDDEDGDEDEDGEDAEDLPAMFDPAHTSHCLNQIFKAIDRAVQKNDHVEAVYQIGQLHGILAFMGVTREEMPPEVAIYDGLLETHRRALKK